MHSNRRYKICICSVILGALEYFRNYKGFSIIFPKILDALNVFKKVIIFLIAPHHIFESEHFRFFGTKSSLIWTVKCEKFNFRKS